MEQGTQYGADLPVACSMGQEARGASELPVVIKTSEVGLEGRGRDGMAEMDGRGFGWSTLPIAELDGKKAG